MKWMSLLLSLVFLKACGDSDATPKITVKPNANTYVAGDTLKVQLKHKKSLELTQVQCFLDDSPITLPYVFTAEKLGDHRLSATALMEGREVKAKERSVRLLKSSPP